MVKFRGKAIQGIVRTVLVYLGVFYPVFYWISTIYSGMSKKKIHAPHFLFQNYV